MEAIKTTSAVPEERGVQQGKDIASLSCAAEIRALPAAFSLAEPMKYPGKQMPTASYTYGKDANSFKDWDW